MLTILIFALLLLFLFISMFRHNENKRTSKFNVGDIDDEGCSKYCHDYNVCFWKHFLTDDCQFPTGCEHCDPFQ